MKGRTLPRRGRVLAAGAVVLWAALPLFPGCGAKSIVVGSVPFPADRPVLVDQYGKETAGLPPASEPIRLVVIDSPWCLLCGEAWTAVASAAATFPPGSVRIYRILFDRERVYAPGGIRESPSLRPPVFPGPADDRTGAPIPEVTTLTALSGPFRDHFRVGRVPVLLLLNEGGMVEKRWVGYQPSLAGQLAEEVRRRAGSPPPTGK